jgi:hypothetical protein
MLRKILLSLVDAKDIKKELLQIYAEDPSRSRIANAVSHSLETPQVKQAFKNFIDTWMREIKRDYYD